MVVSSLIILLPEIALSLFSMVIILVGVFSQKANIGSSALWATVTMFVIISGWIVIALPIEQTAFDGAFRSDSLAVFFKVMLLLSAAIILAMSKEYLDRNNLLNYEYSALISLALVGMLMMVSATNLMSLYLGLELQSLSLYVIAAFRRDNLKSTEAGLKYFVLGALSSGLLLYGASLVYGFTGTTDFAGISNVVETESMSVGLLLGLVFMIVGMGFKVSAVPFHMWTPDVYEGSPTPVTAFFATVPKVAAIGMLVRFLFYAFDHAIDDWQQILMFLAVVSMVVGSIAAIGQNNIKRLMAYSSISHVGFILIGLAIGNIEGLNAVLIYLLVYVIANFGVFSFILSMQKDSVAITEISSLSLYSKINPLGAFLLSITILSLAGLPPLVGFFAKLYIFLAAVNSGFTWLAIVGGISSVIGAYYYLRIVFLIYFGDVSGQLDNSIPLVNWLILLFSGLAMLLGTINLFGFQKILNPVVTSFLY